MKKCLSLVSAAILVFSVSIADAMPTQAEKHLTGNFNSLPQGWSIDAEFDYTFDFHLDNGADLESWWAGIDFVYEYQPDKIFDIYIGAVQFTQMGSLPVQNRPSDVFEGESQVAPAFGLNGKFLIFDRALFPDQPDASFFVTSGVRAAHPDIDEVSHAHPGSVMSLDEADFLYLEWQVAFGFNQDVLLGDLTLPFYFGVKYSDALVDFGGNAIVEIPTPSGSTEGRSLEPFSDHADSFIGVFVGLQFEPIKDSFEVSVEGRFINETGISVSGTIPF